MEKSELLKIKKFCEKLIRSQSKIALEGFFKNKEIKLKRGKSIVTKYDILISKNIVKALSEKYTNFNIKSEERRFINKNSDYTFFIDPIDGTRAFAYKLGFFSIGIGLAYKDDIIFCINYDPILKDMYYAINNFGAYLNDKKIKVSKVDRLEDSMIFILKTEISKKYFVNLVRKVKNRNFSFSSFKTTDYISEGNLEAYIGKAQNLWDLSQYLLVKEAGGKVTDFKGKEFNLKSKSFVFSNGLIHNKILKIVNSRK